MKQALKCVVSLRTKSEEKLPLNNISLLFLFEIDRSYNPFNMTALSGQNPERRNTGAPKGQQAEGSKRYTSLRQNIISYCSYWYIVWYWYIPPPKPTPPQTHSPQPTADQSHSHTQVPKFENTPF